MIIFRFSLLQFVWLKTSVGNKHGYSGSWFTEEGGHNFTLWQQTVGCDEIPRARIDFPVIFPFYTTEFGHRKFPYYTGVKSVSFLMMSDFS